MPGGLVPLGAGFRPLISVVLRGLDATLGDEAQAQIVTWLDLLVAWNAKIDLTAARSSEELVDLMLADALVLARHEPSGVAVVDVGSGAGAPGLALALVRPELSLTLVEPLAKRVSFLRTVVGHLGSRLSQGGSLRVVRATGEEVAAKQGASFQTAIARATLPPQSWLDLGARLIAPEGAVWVFLAQGAAPEAPGWEIQVDERYIWPLTGASRRAIRYRAVPDLR